MRIHQSITLSIIVATWVAIGGVLAQACLAAEPSPLAALTDPEKDYYEKVFDYTMDYVNAGTQYSWASYGGKGTIQAGEPFTSKSGTLCRNFSENFTVHNKQGIDKGFGCKRKGKKGWCKLDQDKEAKTCSFEDTSRMFGGISLSVPGMANPSMGVGGADINTNINTDINTNANVNTNVDTGISSKDVSAKGYADTVTSSAGKSAGTAISNGVKWFGETFSR